MTKPQTNSLTQTRYKTVLDVLSPEHYAELKEQIDGNQFGWYFLNDHNYGLATDDEAINFGFRHLLIADNNSNSGFSGMVLPIVFAIKDAVGQKLEEIVSVHANMTINIGRQHGGHPHTDCQSVKDTETSELYSAIYYVDDCDGDTLFFEDDKKTVFHRQTPVANSMIVFHRTVTHSATLPMVSQKRRIINFNCRFERPLCEVLVG